MEERGERAQGREGAHQHEGALCSCRLGAGSEAPVSGRASGLLLVPAQDENYPAAGPDREPQAATAVEERQGRTQPHGGALSGGGMRVDARGGLWDTSVVPSSSHTRSDHKANQHAQGTAEDTGGAHGNGAFPSALATWTARA
ncbi:hypothetical protein TREES_T100011672 [Tupaia chinensis]|uniref:Uncharacterized protein n=1 Tax=Tupaia chinensis TaxID=246437 RepID=L9L1P5_TUPCH|nr:hypothetical protein TREES_T100011672 [Tupaia chinensis]